MPGVRVRSTHYGRQMIIRLRRSSNCFINTWRRGIINHLHCSGRNWSLYVIILFSEIRPIGRTLFLQGTLTPYTKKDSPGSGLSLQSVAVRYYFFRSEKEKKSTLFIV